MPSLGAEDVASLWRGTVCQSTGVAHELAQYALRSCQEQMSVLYIYVQNLAASQYLKRQGSLLHWAMLATKSTASPASPWLLPWHY